MFLRHLKRRDQRMTSIVRLRGLKYNYYRNMTWTPILSVDDMVQKVVPTSLLEKILFLLRYQGLAGAQEQYLGTNRCKERITACMLQMTLRQLLVIAFNAPGTG